MNTILDDIAVVIGLSPTLKLVAWFGDGIANLYVPDVAEEGQLLPKIIGLPAARALSREWPKKHLHIPRLHNYDIELRRGAVSRMLAGGFTTREIAGVLQMSERRVMQIKDELRTSGLPVAPDGSLDAPGGSTEGSNVVLRGSGAPPAVAGAVDAMLRRPVVGSGQGTKTLRIQVKPGKRR